jgi:hypothetical protein
MVMAIPPPTAVPDSTSTVDDDPEGDLGLAPSHPSKNDTIVTSAPSTHRRSGHAIVSWRRDRHRHCHARVDRAVAPDGRAVLVRHAHQRDCVSLLGGDRRVVRLPARAPRGAARPGPGAAARVSRLRVRATVRDRGRPEQQSGCVRDGVALRTPEYQRDTDFHPLREGQTMHWGPTHIGWYLGNRERVLCQNFYEAACQVTRLVREIDIVFRHTPS